MDDRAAFNQRVDFRLRQPERGEDLAAVLADDRRAAVHTRLRVAVTERHAGRANRARDRVLHLDDHADQPEWLSHVNAGMLKVKLATALISISSIHLLKTFITVQSNPALNNHGVMWQVIIHVVFVFSAIALAWTDKLMMAGVKAQHDIGTSP